MICAEGARLRRVWWGQCAQMAVPAGRAAPSVEQLVRISLERQQPGYQAAVEALREHNQICEICREGKLS